MPGPDSSAFWRDNLAGHAPTRLPRWAAAPAEGEIHLTVAMPDQVAGLAAALREPLDRIVLAAVIRVAGLLAGEPDVTIGQRSAAAEPAVPLRVRLPDGSWRDLIAAVRAAEEAVAEHRAHPPATPLPLDVAFWPEPGRGDNGAALSVWCTPAKILLRCEATQFDEAYLARFGGYLTTAIMAMAADPDASCLDADLLSASERHHLLVELAGPVCRLPDEPAHKLIARQAHDRPDAIAVLYRGQRWTYDRVNRAANQIAHALLAAGLRAQEVVAVCTERDPHWLCAVLGIFKAGGCYLPIEPGYPAGRVAELVSRANVRFALTGPARHAAMSHQGEVRSWPVADLLDAGRPDTDPAVDVAPDQLAYVYFTSGSTGVPKGAMCEHLGLINHLMAKVHDFGIGPDDVVVQSTRQSFDISLWQLIAALTVGGRTLILPTDQVLDARRLVDAIVAHGATILQVVPAYLDVLLRYLEQHPRDLARLRLVCVVGEAVIRPLVSRWFARCPHITLVNAYGATEASDQTTHEIMSAPPRGEIVPVGRPVNNVTVYVLGPGESLRPLGTPGEIVFSGICVGRGYINDAERTAEAFAADPFRPGHRIYRTGDYGRWLPNGSLEFHGRRDEQIKIHGVRIELGEVEARAVGHPLVQAASVVVAALPGGVKSLAVFYTSADGLDPADLRAHLAGSLPSGAMPTWIERIESLPLTANGKVDKRMLASLALSSQAAALSRAPTAPDTPTQRRIASAWAQAMNRPAEDIGRDDNFFELGGSSLAALRVVASLDGLVALDDLVRNPVLSALAAVADGSRGEPGGMLRLLAGPATGHSAALVCFPYAAGTAISFQALAAALAVRDTGLAVYAVQPPGHDLGRRDVPLAELDELTKLLASEVAAIAAPVALWGHCDGAAAALETARLLDGAVRHVFIAAKLLEPSALAKQLAAVTAAADADLGAEFAAGGGLDGLADTLSRADLAFIGRVYRHDTRIANQYLIQAAQTWQQRRLNCRLTVVAAASDPLTGGYRDRFADWDAFSERTSLAEIADGGHYFPRTRPDLTADVIMLALQQDATEQTVEESRL